jgi:DNA-binding PadR family transcriptional regulator
MNRSKDLCPNSASTMVLGILHSGESYGYAIAQRLRELSGGEVEWSDGMLYPILHRLQAEGLINARWGSSETGRKRKYYQLSARTRFLKNDDRRPWRAVKAILDRLWAMEIAPGAAAQSPTVLVSAV